MTLGLQLLRLDQDRAADVVAHVVELAALPDRTHAAILAASRPQASSGCTLGDVRRVVALTPDRLDQLAEALPCGSCAFWELDPVRRARVHGAAAVVAEKHAWLSQVLREWGSCGRVVLVDDVPVGYVVYAPASFVPGAAGFPTAPVSPDAVLLTTVHVAAEHARRRARPGAGAGDGPRPHRPGRRARRGGVRAPVAGAAGAWCRRTSSATSASAPTGRTRRRPGCGWTCAPR